MGFFLSENLGEFLKNFCLVCDEAPWSVCVINFSVVSRTMVFLFLVWMGVIILIQFFQIQDLWSPWFAGTKIILPEGKDSTKFYILFYIGFLWN